MTNDTLKYNDMPLSEIADNAKEEASNRLNQAKETARKAAITTKDYVTNNPFKALAITLGIGLVVGILASRRS